MPNLYTSRPQSNWGRAMIHRCSGCAQDFRSEHTAAFHSCPRTEDDVQPELKRIGHINEMGELSTRPVSDEYLECGGMDIAFVMHARAFRNLLLEAELALANDTDIGKTEMLKKFVKILREAK